MSESSLIATVKGAVEGSVSVLLTLTAGYLVTRAGLLDRATTKKVSNVASLVFLPCLIIVQMSPELTPQLLSKVWILPVWGLVSTLIAHGFGWVGKSVLKLPNWTIIAAGRPNSSALPLLLIEALSNTGVLDSLKRPDESTDDTLSRAKSLILLNVIVQQIITFVAGPSILTGGNNKNDERRDRLLPGPSQGSRPSIQDTEHVGLLHDHNSEDGYGSIADPHRFERSLRELDNTPNFHWPTKLQFLEKPAKTIGSFMNAPVVGALIAFTIGMVAPLHHAFLDEDEPLYNSLTKSVDNLGSLFVGLQMFIVGAQLATVPSSNPKVVPTAYVLSIRYIVMPALAVLFVFLTAGKGWYTDDPLVWFLLVLIPSGPSAMVLASLAELVDTDQGPVAGYLTIAYCFSPLIAIACAVGLAVVQSKTGAS